MKKIKKMRKQVAGVLTILMLINSMGAPVYAAQTDFQETASPGMSPPVTEESIQPSETTERSEASSNSQESVDRSELHSESQGEEKDMEQSSELQGEEGDTEQPSEAQREEEDTEQPSESQGEEEDIEQPSEPQEEEGNTGVSSEQEYMPSETEEDIQKSDDPLTDPGIEVQAQEEESEEDIDYVLGRPMTAEEEEEQRRLISEYASRLVPLEADEAVDSILDDSEPMVRAGSQPSSYTLDDIAGKITSVKNQNPYGACWAFAVMNSAELSLIHQGLADPDSIDLSERHLVYYTGHLVTDPLGGTAGDRNTFGGSVASLFNRGGNYTRATRTLSMWMGAASESAAPYSQAETALPETQEKAYGQNTAVLKNVYAINKKDVPLIKQAIRDHGAVGIMYYSPSEEEYYNPDTAAQYCNVAETENHGVSIVGWDDDYSVDNFSIRPSRPGAWLVKNSWGDWYGNGGYFWLSYEDASINDSFFVFEMQPSGTYDNNYQYDGSSLDSYYLAQGSVQIANVFTAHANSGKKESLKAVSFLSGGVNCSYSIQIYKNPSRPDDPTSGTPALSSPQSGQAAYDGYYTVPLNQPVELSEGEKFAVVITLSRSDGDIKVMMEWTGSSTYDSVASAASGQSFYKSSSYGSWLDVGTRQNANLRIKAFTNNLDTNSDRIAVTGITMQETSGRLYVGDDIPLTASVMPPNATNKAVIWSSSDRAVAEVDENGLVKGLKKGEAVITATTVDGGYKAEYRLTVAERYESVQVTGTAVLERVGDTCQFSAVVLPTEAPDRSVSWSSSNPSVAKVDSYGKVTAVGIGRTVIQAAANGDRRIIGTMEVTVPLNSVNQVRSFVTRMYTNVLLRDAETAGLNDWSNRLLTRKADGASLAQGFIGSDEFNNKGVRNQVYVEILYKTFFDREADAGGKEYWMNRLENGMSREYVLRGFVNSEEFQNLCDSYGIDRGEMKLYACKDQNEGLTMFVNRLYVKALGRGGEDEGIEDWTGRILRGETTAGDVAKSFFFSDEFVNKHLSDTEYVKTLYRTFMDREYDQAGLNDWVSRLAGGTGREQVLNGFADSEEFGNIMRSYGVY